MLEIKKGSRDFSKTPLTNEEHEEFDKILRNCSESLAPWMQRFYYAYSVNGKECKQLRKLLRILTGEIRWEQDRHWYLAGNKDASPYDKNKRTVF